MKYIEVDEELYRYIAGKTEHIGESASDILRRLLDLSTESKVQKKPTLVHEPSTDVHQVKLLKPSGQQVSKNTVQFDQLLSEKELKNQKGAVGRFLFSLTRLYEVSPTDFAQVLQIQGRGRLYFATSKEALLQASKSANPKEIGNSGYWVTTNNNTLKKQAILAEVYELLGCDSDLALKLASKI